MNTLVAEFLYPTSFKRFVFFFFLDILIVVTSLYLSFMLRFDFVVEDGYFGIFINALPLFLVVKLFTLWLFKVYRSTWRYVGLSELFNILNATIVSESLLMVLILVPLPQFLYALHIPEFKEFPRSIFIMDGVLSFLLISGLRISKRIVMEIIREKGPGEKGKRTIIIGAGNTGDMMLRNMAKQGYNEFYPVGMLDDSSITIGTYLHGVEVLGTTDKLKNVIPEYHVEAVIIAIPTLNYKVLRNIYNSANEAGVNTVKIIPRLYGHHKPDIPLKDLEEIRIEDLIGRQSVEVDYKEIGAFINGKTVLITGAGGSIGSEITFQTCNFQPARVILFDIDETALHNMELKLKRAFPQLSRITSFVAGDVKDENRVSEVFAAFKPQIVFHAAAYKHVPMMEYNPKEAVKVNMFGTHTVTEASVDHGVEKFIMISTDKAVRPTSVMGATKRMAENIVRGYNKCSRTEFISVRFGNVLGSRGSVLPLFMEQLKYGGPITVTHKDMQRYFMTIPEAVSLVLQASVIGKGGDVLVLDMGGPVRIVKLAEELIKIHGLNPYTDIDIEFTGIRPGEKLFEELLTAEEGAVASRHERVFIAKDNDTQPCEEIERILIDFDSLVQETNIGDEVRIKDLLRTHVPHFIVPPKRPQHVETGPRTFPVYAPLHPKES